MARAIPRPLLPALRPAPGLLRRLEWRTVAVGGVLYGAFGLLTWLHPVLPWWLTLPLGGYLVAWHGSLQHEAIHGHPSRSAALNEALVFPSLTLLVPYRLYRESHLAHHRDARLTDPLADPESFYVTAETWRRAGRAGRWLLRAHATLAGRLLLGPPWLALRLLRDQLPRLARGEPAARRAWLPHLGGCALVLGWTWGVCGIAPGTYLALFVYPGLALTLLRSYAEHRAAPGVAQRTALVESGPLMSLLYLSNNLHALHHAEPELPWYRLRGRYRERRAELLEHNGGYLYRGYGEVAARHLLRPRGPVVHPLHAGAGTPAGG